MTDVSFSPADVGVVSEAIVLPLQVDYQAVAGVASPVPLVANNWDGYELGNVRLDRITRFEMSPGLNQGVPESMSPNMQRFYQGNVEETEKSINGLSATIAVLQRTIEDIAVAQAKAEEASQDANEAIYESALLSSYTEPPDIVMGYENGDVVIASHTRVYGDGRQVLVDGDTLSGFAAGEVVRPFYDDFDQMGGAVAWKASTSGVLAQSNGIHLTGYVTIPTATAPPAEGEPSYPPGFDIP